MILPGTSHRLSLRGLRRLGLLVLMLAVTALPSWADYLREVGPASLRFQKPVEFSMASLGLPPFPSSATSAAPATVTTTNATPTLAAKANPSQQTEKPDRDIAAANPSTDPGAATRTSPGPVTGPAEEAPSGPAQQSDVVTPQMMLQYFQRRVENNPARETGVALPVVFTPPSPPAMRPSSQATYSTPSAP